MADQAAVQKIADKVFDLAGSPIDVSRKEQVAGFLATMINGDSAITDSLVISANFGKDREGVAVYVLTNVRLIKINIDAKDNTIKSSSFFIHKLRTEWKISDGDKSEVRISTNDEDAFSLAYSNKDITAFFQKVDQARIEAEVKNAQQ